jgi:hypothetical protein
MTTIAVPDTTEFAPYYLTYVSKVPTGDIREILESQGTQAVSIFRAISEDRSRHRYAPDKWSIRESIHHVNDAERVFAYRALWFARGLGTELQSFDQDVAVRAAGADRQSWKSIVDEFASIRATSVSLFKSMPDDGWQKQGTASGNPVTVRALAYIIAGHTAHHLQVLKERYL